VHNEHATIAFENKKIIFRLKNTRMPLIILKIIKNIA
jgi:hypothetical protein